MNLCAVVINTLFLGSLAFGQTMPLSHSWLEAKAPDRKLPPVGNPIRLEMLAEVRSALTNESLQLQYGKSRITLLGVELGDEKLLEQFLASEFAAPSGGASVATARLLATGTEPSIIKALSRYLVLDEPTTELFVQEHTRQRLSVAATRIILSVAIGAEQLPPAVRDWAASEFYAIAYDFERTRSVVRQFWQENTTHFAEKNYQAVKPPTSTAQNPAETGATRRTPSPPMIPPKIALPPVANQAASSVGGQRMESTGTAAPSKPVAAPPSAVAAGGGGLGWGLAVLCSAVIAYILARARRRRPSQPH